MQKMKSLDNLSNTSKETVARLLDVAEILFSDLGYAGTTVRDIAAKSQINQALINYHFKNKRGLFMAIFERRGKVLFEERLMLLSQARNKAGSKPIPLRDLLYAFIYPLCGSLERVLAEEPLLNCKHVCTTNQKKLNKSCARNITTKLVFNLSMNCT